MSNAWIPTMAKLASILTSLENSIKTGKYEDSVELVSKLKHYADCNYCQTYRTVLVDRSENCCKSCPLHKYGEKMVNRPISYNGCYKIASYRDTVRTAWVFCNEPNEILTKMLITSIKECMNQMTIHRSEVEF